MYTPVKPVIAEILWLPTVTVTVAPTTGKVERLTIPDISNIALHNPHDSMYPVLQDVQYEVLVHELQPLEPIRIENIKST
jgi:hypothetical protein